MPSRGLFIGINDYPGTNLDLAGCVNDAHDWQAALDPYLASTLVLTDRSATRARILSAAKSLLKQLRAGDWGVIAFSGHGSWVPDRNGDEPDGRDECLIPYDYRRPILDDEIYLLLQERPAGSNVFLVSDCCNSGTVFRMFQPPGLTGTHLRFMDPARFLEDDQERTRAERIAPRVRVPKTPMSPGIIHFAGCQDVQFSYDGVFDGRPNGAFTYCALRALERMRSTSSFQSWFNYICRSLPTTQYPQTPKMNARPTDAKWKLPWA